MKAILVIGLLLAILLVILVFKNKNDRKLRKKRLDKQEELKKRVENYNKKF